MVCITPLEYTQLITLAANLTAEFADDDTLAFLALIFTQYADTLATIAAIRAEKKDKI